MYNSRALPNGFNLSSPPGKKDELQSSREEMEFDLQHRHHQQQQMSPGLTRLRSAPSSLLANFMDSGSGEVCDDFIPRSSSPDAESMFARFMTCSNGDLSCSDLRGIEEKPSVATSRRSPQFRAGTEVMPQPNGFASAPQIVYQAPLPNHSPAAAATVEAPYYRVANSMAMDSSLVKSRSNGPNLIRHSSSPAGLFSHLPFENGYAVVRGVSNFRGGNGSTREAAASTSRLKNQVSFSSRQVSSPGILSQISEVGSESNGDSSPDDGSLGNDSGGRSYIPGFPMPSWDDSPLENFTGLKRVKDINGKMIPSLAPSEGQNAIAGSHASGLSHQLSLPKTSSEMAALEKFLHFQDSVPCKIRAKRGCATHPRSIAERVRRTRISERMRKLQELVPNMEKQTNTADMLDLAVEYIKELQKQVQTLSDNRASCSCSSKQKPYLNSPV